MNKNDEKRKLSPRSQAAYGHDNFKLGRQKEWYGRDFKEVKESTKRDGIKLVHQQFDDENGVIIEGWFPKDFKCEAIPWNSEDKFAMIGNDLFPVGFKFETDIFDIKETKTGHPIDINETPAENVLIKTPLLTKDAREEMYYQYRGAVQFADILKFVEPITKGGYMVFNVDKIESFCVISFVPEQKCKISPDGGQFVSTGDNRVQVHFPPHAVNKTDEILFKVHPVEVNGITEISREDDSAVPISAITPSLSANHMTFQRLLEIQLPVQRIPGANVDDDDYKYTVFRWEKDGSLQPTGIDPLFTNGILSFETSSFSGFVGAAGSKSSSETSIKYAVEEAMGFRKWCKILFFVGKKQNNRMKLILQCVEIQKMSVMCDLRKKFGFHFVADCMSSNLFLPPDTTVIDVDIKGRFSLPKASAIRHHKVRFIPSGGDIFTEIQVELKANLSGQLYGILVLRHGKDILQQIFYDPDSNKPTLPHKLITNEMIGIRREIQERNRSAVKEFLNEDQVVEIKTERTINNFFTEKGILALTKQMTPEVFFEVCIYMNMKKAQFEGIRKQYQTSAEGNLTILQTAIDNQPNDRKLECLIRALESAGQKTLAEKIDTLWSTQKDLDTIAIAD